jgi:4-diphosphocytidyl-2-C-methyl-D-erythritol kinase
MIVLPPAKINLGLHVVSLRPDGYRNIRTVMLPVPLHDLLEAVVDPELPAGAVVMTHSGRPVPGDPAKDLCIRAVEAIARERQLPGLRIHLHKVIPTGAGLGGGSSDAAYTLLLLNDLLDLHLPYAELHALAAGLGSDCAFFLRSSPQLAEGRGELLTPTALDLSGWWLVLANPGTHVSTAEVYAHTPVRPSTVDLPELLSQGPAHWTGNLVNDMEDHVFSTRPEVADLHRDMQRMGATYVAMSGSGSTIYGIFRKRPDLSSVQDKVILCSRF